MSHTKIMPAYYIIDSKQLQILTLLFTMTLEMHPENEWTIGGP